MRPLALRQRHDSVQRREVRGERLPPSIRKTSPRALTTVHRTLVHFHLANVFQRLEVPGEYRIADSNRLAQQLEFRLFERRKQCADPEAIGCVKHGIEL